jgi:hypothetical protein
MPFTVKDWKDYPDTTTPITAAALEDLEDRVTDYADAGGPIKVTGAVANDSGAPAKAANVTAFNAAIALANTAESQIAITGGTYYFTSSTTLTRFTGALGWVCYGDVQLIFDNAAQDCIVMKGLRKSTKGHIWIDNQATTTSGWSLRLKNVAYSNFDSILARADGASAGCVLLEQEFVTAVGTGNTTNLSPTISNVSASSGTFTIGQRIAGTNVPANATITNVVGNVITMSGNATGTGTGVAINSADDLDAFMLVHLGPWYNRFEGLAATYGANGTTSSNVGKGITFEVAASAVSAVNPPHETAGTYTGSVNFNTVAGFNVEGKSRGIEFSRAGQNIFSGGGQFLGCDAQIYGRNSSSENVFIGMRHTGWGTNPYDLDSSCRNTFIIAPILFKAGGGAPWSLGSTGTNPKVFASNEFVDAPELNLAGIFGQEKHVIGFRGATAETQLASHTGTSSGRPRVNLGGDGTVYVGRSSGNFVEISNALEFPVAITSASAPNNSIFRDSADNVLKKKDNTGTVTAI